MASTPEPWIYRKMLAKFLKRLDYLLLTLWIGGIWVTGYVVAPVLFSSLDDRSLAAMVAGKLFSIMGVIGLYCGTLLLFIIVAGPGRWIPFRPMFALWLVFEIGARFSNLPGLYISIVYAVVFVGFLRLQLHTGYYRLWQFWVVLVMLLFTAIGYFYLAPTIEAMRISGEAARASDQFKILHGSASVLYLLTSLGGLALIFGGIPRTRSAALNKS